MEMCKNVCCPYKVVFLLTRTKSVLHVQSFFFSKLDLLLLFFLSFSLSSLAEFILEDELSVSDGQFVSSINPVLRRIIEQNCSEADSS